jgi:hypothetical protein
MSRCLPPSGFRLTPDLQNALLRGYTSVSGTNSYKEAIGMLRFLSCVSLPAISLVATLALFTVKTGQPQPPRLPQGYGLSSRYPGDIGIENDSAVLFAENFEKGTLEEIAKSGATSATKTGRSCRSATMFLPKVLGSVRCK